FFLFFFEIGKESSLLTHTQRKIIDKMNILLLLMANFVCIMTVDKEANFDLTPHDIICPFCCTN
ncbi:unnamed protein product, partial [Onchocerca ochengi]